MNILKGWKTVLFNGILFVVGVLDMLGVGLPDDFASEVNGALVALIGVVGVILRNFTNSEIGWKILGR
jgi:uncharacterized membrane protein